MGISTQEAYTKYIEIAEQLPTYGITFFKVTVSTIRSHCDLILWFQNFDGDGKATEALFFGIAEEGIYTFQHPSKVLAPQSFAYAYTYYRNSEIIFLFLN